MFQQKNESMVARHVKLWERGAERYGLLGVLRGAQMYFFFRSMFCFLTRVMDLAEKEGLLVIKYPAL